MPSGVYFKQTPVHLRSKADRCRQLSRVYHFHFCWCRGRASTRLHQIEQNAVQTNLQSWHR
jgi:hypothetical protein